MTAASELHLVLVVSPWQLLHHAHAAAEILSTAVPEPHRTSVHYANLTLAELLHASDPDTGLDVDLYHRIADAGYLTGLGDWIFTRALYGRSAQVPPFVQSACAAIGVDYTAALALHQLAERWADQAADDILARDPDVVGFSTTFAQSVASLAIARRLKGVRPGLPVIFGGSNCDDTMGPALQRAFPAEIDFVVRGEAETALPSLIHALATGDRDQLEAIAGLCWWQEERQQVQAETSTLPVGEDLRAGDQRSYFVAVENSPVRGAVRPGLVLETSRGCWWGERKHCTFCGLSDRAIRFRSKSAATAGEHLLDAVTRHQVLDITTTDNILDLGYLDTLLPELAALGLDLHLFYEIKANLSSDQIGTLRRAGVLTVQPGIENLHSVPLKLMDKGSTGAGNVALLRDLQQHGMTTMWNYLYGFPGETDEHYLPIIEQLPNLVHLLPPDGANRHVVERFNPYFLRPELGFPEHFPMPWYRWVYPHISPDELAELAYLFSTPPAGIGDDTAAALREAVSSWQEGYATSQLTHRLVDGVLAIYDRRRGQLAVDYLIEDQTAVAAYLELARPHSASRLTRRLQTAGHEVETGWVADFVAELRAAGLLFCDGALNVTLSLDHDPSLLRVAADPASAEHQVAERASAQLVGR